MKRRLMSLGMMGIAMAMASGAGDFPGYGMPRMPRGRSQRQPDMPKLRHAGEIPKGCKLEKEILKFTTGEYNISVEVDVVFSNPKTRAKKLNATRMGIAYYIRCRGLHDIKKDKRFTVEPIIIKIDEAAI